MVLNVLKENGIDFKVVRTKVATTIEQEEFDSQLNKVSLDKDEKVSETEDQNDYDTLVSILYEASQTSELVNKVSKVFEEFIRHIDKCK